MKRLSLRNLSLMFIAVSQALCVRAAVASSSEKLPLPAAARIERQETSEIPLFTFGESPNGQPDPWSIRLIREDMSSHNLQNALRLHRKWGGYTQGFSLVGDFSAVRLSWSLQVTRQPGDIRYIRDNSFRRHGPLRWRQDINRQDDPFFNYSRNETGPLTTGIVGAISFLGFRWSVDLPVDSFGNEPKTDRIPNAAISRAGEGFDAITETGGFRNYARRGRRMPALGASYEWVLARKISLLSSQTLLGRPDNLRTLTQAGLQAKIAGVNVTLAGGMEVPLNGSSPSRQGIQGGAFLFINCGL